MLTDALCLELRDPLAEVLGGCPPGGTFRYTFEDVVKLSGHSCPTVAGAFLMTAAGLRALYPEELPVRGEIAVSVGGSPEDGRAGPMAQVIALITGAATETGFKGLMGHWARKNLLQFVPSLGGRIRFERTDTHASVELEYHPERVPAAAESGPLLAKVLSGKASTGERQEFTRLWQARVQAILADPSRVVSAV